MCPLLSEKGYSEVRSWALTRKQERTGKQAMVGDVEDGELQVVCIGVLLFHIIPALVTLEVYSRASQCGRSITIFC
jgi:hypothetical protein